MCDACAGECAADAVVKMRRICWRHFVIGVVILTMTLLLAIYVPAPPISMRGARSGMSLAVLVSIFGEFAGRYYFFLLPLLFALYELREAFRKPKADANKL
jgi:hypothetical protein